MIISILGLLIGGLSSADHDTRQGGPARCAREQECVSLAPIPRGKVGKLADMPICTFKRLKLGEAERLLGQRPTYEFNYVVSVAIFSDTVVSQSVYEGLSQYGTFVATRRKNGDVKIASHRMGNSTKRRGMPFLMQARRSVTAVACEAYITE